MIVNRTLGVDPIGESERNAVLKIISDGRAKLASVSERLITIPGWLQQPMKDDQAEFDAAFREYQRHDPVVISLDQRLRIDQGPLWRPLSDQEKASLDAWTAGIDTMSQISARYFPTSTESDIKKIVLLVLGVAAFAAPLFLTEDVPHQPMRLWPKPPALPPWSKPSSVPRLPMVSRGDGIQRPSGGSTASPIFGGERRTTFRSPGAFTMNRPPAQASASPQEKPHGLPAPGSRPSINRPSGGGFVAPSAKASLYRSIKRT